MTEYLDIPEIKVYGSKDRTDKVLELRDILEGAVVPEIQEALHFYGAELIRDATLSRVEDRPEFLDQLDQVRRLFGEEARKTVAIGIPWLRLRETEGITNPEEIKKYCQRRKEISQMTYPVKTIQIRVGLFEETVREDNLNEEQPNFKERYLLRVVSTLAREGVADLQIIAGLHQEISAQGLETALEAHVRARDGKHFFTRVGGKEKERRAVNYYGGTDIEVNLEYQVLRIKPGERGITLGLTDLNMENTQMIIEDKDKIRTIAKEVGRGCWGKAEGYPLAIIQVLLEDYLAREKLPEWKVEIVRG
ncbi:MAG: hypothetical protein V2A62_02910 [Candidatus Woesearchaeota archaeon]